MTDLENTYIRMLRRLSRNIVKFRANHPEVFFSDFDVRCPGFRIDRYCHELGNLVHEFRQDNATDTEKVAKFLLVYILESGTYDRVCVDLNAEKSSCIYQKFYEMAGFGTQDIPEDMEGSISHALQLITDERFQNALKPNGQAVSCYEELSSLDADSIRKACLMVMVILMPFLPEDTIAREFQAYEIPYRPQLRTERKLRRNGHFDPVSIKRKLDEAIVGQDDQKAKIAAALYNHRLCYETGIRPPRNVILLTGPTGSGKTLTAKTIAESMDLPYVICEASQITADGWKGLDKGDIFAELYGKSSDQKKCSYGIVILDEFDKGCFQGMSGDGENVGRRWQSNFLSMFEGTPVRKEDKESHTSISYETKNILYILTGSFGELREKEEHMRRPDIGFSSCEATSCRQASDWDLQSMQKKLVDIGLFPELAGRITAVLQLKELTEDQIFQAIMNPTSDFLPKQRQLLTADGKELAVDEAFIRSAIHQGIRDGLGVRGCRNLISERLMEAIYDAFMQHSDTVNLTFRERAC